MNLPEGPHLAAMQLALACGFPPSDPRRTSTAEPLPVLGAPKGAARFRARLLTFSPHKARSTLDYVSPYVPAGVTVPLPDAVTVPRLQLLQPVWPDVPWRVPES